MMIFALNFSFKPSCTSLLNKDFSRGSVVLYNSITNHKLYIRSMSPFAKGDSGGFKPDGLTIETKGQ